MGDADLIRNHWPVKRVFSLFDSEDMEMHSARMFPMLKADSSSVGVDPAEMNIQCGKTRRGAEFRQVKRGYRRGDVGVRVLIGIIVGWRVHRFFYLAA